MRSLALDIGNTHLHWGVFEGEDLQEVGKLPTVGEWSLPLGSWAGVDVVGVASVNRTAADRLRTRWAETAAPALIWLGVDQPIPVEIRGPDRAQVGADRLLNALAWKQRSSQPAVIVDFGTAITFDLVSRQGEYLGGLILPGPELISRALHLGTSLLPPVEIRPTPEPFGQDTETAIRRGVFGLLRGGVEFHLAELRAVLSSDTVFVATGGGAATYAPWFVGLELEIPSLTLEGIRIAVELVRGP